MTKRVLGTALVFALFSATAMAQTTLGANPTMPPAPEPFGGDVNQSDTAPTTVATAGQTGGETRDDPSADLHPQRPGCEPQDERGTSETPPVEGADAGTAPGGSGSSGWTGGLGGSDIGTSQSDSLDSSPNEDQHPEIASGLDPISGETAVTGPASPPPPADDPQTVANETETGDPC